MTCGTRWTKGRERPRERSFGEQERCGSSRESAEFPTDVNEVVAMCVLAFVSTFIGIVTDPIQAKLGLHQRRLRKLVKAVEQDLLGKSAGQFQLREKYMGRVFDVVDFLAFMGRSV